MDNTNCTAARARKLDLLLTANRKQTAPGATRRRNARMICEADDAMLDLLIATAVDAELDAYLAEKAE